jgi:hypothetical protein
MAEAVAAVLPEAGRNEQRVLRRGWEFDVKSGQQPPPVLPIDVDRVVAGRSACAGAVLWTGKIGAMVASPGSTTLRAVAE